MTGIKVRILDTSTDLESNYHDPNDTWDEATSTWQWTEGNYGCDCSRATFFCEGRGEEDFDPEVECNAGANRFKIQIWDEASQSVVMDEILDGGKGDW